MSGTRLSDLAHSLGLNIATVSRALRDDPKVKPETRERIRHEAERLGYRPHVAARALAEGRTRTIWFVIPDLEDAIAREPAWHASRFLLARGYDLLLAQHHNDEAVFRRIVDRLARGGADGAILIPDASAPGSADAALGQARVPFVYLDRRLVGGPEAPVVTTDNFRAGRDLVQTLLDDGRGPDLVVNAFGHHNLNSVEAVRQAGVAAAALEAGVPCIGSREPVPSCRRPLVFASSEETARAVAATLPSPAAGFGVFDHWRAGPRPGARVLVAVQDFESMARVAVERILDTLNGGTSEGAEDFVPLVEIREVR